MGWLSLKFRWFSVESGLQTTTLLRLPLSTRKTGELQPAEVVTVCHRFVTASSPGRKVRKSGSREDSVLGKFESIMEPGDSSMAHEWARLIHECPVAGGTRAPDQGCCRDSALTTETREVSHDPSHKLSVFVLLCTRSFAGLIMRPRCPKRFDRRQRSIHQRPHK